MRLYRTDRGVARLEGEELVVLDLPHRDVAELLADETVRLRTVPARERIPLTEANALAPLAAPSRIAIIGFNYASHVREIGEPLPAQPRFALLEARPDVTAAWNASIVLPREAPAQVDFEGELGVVIGRTARAVRAADVWSYVGGLTVVDDVTARDVQRTAMQSADASLGLGKLFPGFKPCGPAIVTPDEFALESLDLELETLVNGETRQKARTGDFIFSVPALIEAITRDFVLRPGDLICTGTPGGVGAASGTFLKPDDVVEVRIAGIGAVRNRVVAGHA